MRAWVFGGAGAIGFDASGVGRRAFGASAESAAAIVIGPGLSPFDSSIATWPPDVRMVRSFLAKLCRLVSRNGCGCDRRPVRIGTIGLRHAGRPSARSCESTIGCDGYERDRHLRAADRGLAHRDRARGRCPTPKPHSCRKASRLVSGGVSSRLAGRASRAACRPSRRSASAPRPPAAGSRPAARRSRRRPRRPGRRPAARVAASPRRSCRASSPREAVVAEPFVGARRVLLAVALDEVDLLGLALDGLDDRVGRVRSRRDPVARSVRSP